MLPDGWVGCFACGVYCGDLVLFGVVSLVFAAALSLLG